MFCGECGHCWEPDEIASARFCAECGEPREDVLSCSYVHASILLRPSCVVQLETSSSSVAPSSNTFPLLPQTSLHPATA
ncbi:uncharacterized protein PHALS_14623 [Plasmopara halstedii]|uniref:Uncharacterized protein n=1 Tax=Plasmopara halstedii TaxID=4781 RepID=A0A0P1ALU2_PLAHL|nr:uncharacterized protein PHALS_14623 [Plasmopara halstedii]CEG42392.1 hypothetical protein PHALS_14623 [Plasmopara halstedii]|eukprot:XP_024578761.1 hypothetical protein PHALS_14623 [Plasmopara halstedii]